MKISVTGHRPNKLFGYDYKSYEWQLLKETMKKFLKEKKCTEGITGMALGVDMVFALAVLELKEEQNILLHCAIPCLEHTSKWFDKKMIQLYDEILSKADKKFIVTNTPYNQFVMNRRNHYMVDNSDIILSVWDGSKGGTYNCIQYAKEENKSIYRIYPKKIPFKIQLLN